jgi:hypothetical protein
MPFVPLQLFLGQREGLLADQGGNGDLERGSISTPGRAPISRGAR